MTDETTGTETLNSHAKWLRLAADDMGTSEPRHYGWMNTCTEAAAEIDRLTALVATEKERADTLTVELKRERDWINAAVVACAKRRCSTMQRDRDDAERRAASAESALLSEREQAKELRRNAERYRWLRGYRGVKLPMITGETVSDARDWRWLFEDDADAAIDAALARSSTQPQMSDSDLTEGGAG